AEPARGPARRDARPPRADRGAGRGPRVSTLGTRPPAPVTDTEPTPSVRARSPGLLRSVLADRRAWLALPPLLVLVAMAVVPTLLDGAGPQPCLLGESLLTPSLDHPLGTDLQGCDLWA